MINNILIGKLEIKCSGWVDRIDFFLLAITFHLYLIFIYYQQQFDIIAITCNITRLTVDLLTKDFGYGVLVCIGFKTELKIIIIYKYTIK